MDQTSHPIEQLFMRNLISYPYWLQRNRMKDCFEPWPFNKGPLKIFFSPKEMKIEIFIIFLCFMMYILLLVSSYIVHCMTFFWSCKNQDIVLDIDTVLDVCGVEIKFRRISTNQIEVILTTDQSQASKLKKFSSLLWWKW